MSKAKKINPHLGSSLDEFLETEGVRGEFEARAVKEVIAWQLQNAMQEQSISKARMAPMMGTSRTQLNRLLDPDQDVTLSTLNRAATMVGRTLRLELS
jgi:antitoxin HicB